MRKYSLVISLLVFVNVCFSQNPEIKTELPTIIPPSPTVSALMKFEEVPVSNYTGVPDISIPLFSSPTLSKDINLNISLKYHSGVGANDRASDVGLGWSLFAGGTISRTVRGLPDEQLVLDGGTTTGKVGVYHTSISNHNNYYYQHGTNMSQFVVSEFYKANEYLWDIVERGKFDTEHDLWQFNFMGQSGRFYIEKNITTNLLSVVPMDEYRVKIINNYTAGSYVPTSFTIFDERGYKYLFDVIETTINKTAIENISIHNSGTSLSDEKVFNSSFHLSKVYDNNNNLLIDFLFNTDTTLKECTTNTIYTFNDYRGGALYSSPIAEDLIGWYDCFGEFKPFKNYVNSISVINVKKIQSINITGFSKIDLNYVKGQRIDTNIQQIANASSLNNITVKDWNNTIVKKYNFTYSNSTVLDTRMLLQKVEEVSGTNTINSYQLYYETNSIAGFNIGKDFWGYFNLSPNCTDKDIAFENEPSPYFSTTDILQKIKYPTGGCVIFDFEANEYSYIGNEELTNFDENPNNSTLTNTNTLIFSNTTQNNTTTGSNAGIQLLNYSNTEDKKIKIYSNMEYPQDIINAIKSFKLVKLTGASWDPVANITCGFGRSGCCFDFILEQGIQYGIKREILTTSYTGPNDSVTIDYFTKNAIQKKYLYGGGNRIKQIGYFDVDVPENYFENTPNNIFPKKAKEYSYLLPSDIHKSSGSLVFAKPLFKYQSSVKIFGTICLEPPYMGPNSGLIQNIGFIVNTNFNNLISIKTQGSDVGYKYVSVKESGNGRTNYEYTSPIDFPEELLFTNTPPFLPTRNLDFKRGLILKEVTENEGFFPLQEITFSYEYLQTDKTYGMRRYKPDGICFGGRFFNSYASYIPFYENPQGPIFVPPGMNSISSGALCGYPSSYTQQYALIATYGWAKLASKITKNYLYPTANSTPNIVQTNETFTYNTINKQIDEKTVTNSLGEILKTKYYYHTGNSPFSQNRISEIQKIETYRNSELLSTTQIDYSNTFVGNQSFLPQFIKTSKGIGTSETRLRYNRYDPFGNPLEVQQENGMLISYIWGYNNTQPIAKIENASYASITPSLITNAQTASNTGTEASLLTALTALRTALPSAMVTSMTYKPLIGVSTITDPKGDRITYIYDEFNRLKEVRDKDNNILSENQYNYRPQN